MFERHVIKIYPILYNYINIKKIIRILNLHLDISEDSNPYKRFRFYRLQSYTIFIYNVTKRSKNTILLNHSLSKRKFPSQRRTNDIVPDKIPPMTKSPRQKVATSTHTHIYNTYPSELHSITNVGEFTNSFGTRVIEFAIYQDRMRLLNWIVQVEAAGVASLPP